MATDAPRQYHVVLTGLAGKNPGNIDLVVTARVTRRSALTSSETIYRDKHKTQPNIWLVNRILFSFDTFEEAEEAFNFACKRMGELFPATGKDVDDLGNDTAGHDH